mgnify:FL=1
MLFRSKSKQTDISTALEFFSNVTSKKSIAFLLSDFISKDYQKSLSIASKKHDLTGIRIFDKFEEEMPNLGLIPMIDQETDKVEFIDTGSKDVRKNFKINSLKMRDEFETTFKRNGSGTINCRTDQSYVKLLLGYFKNRG